ncbi:MAG: AAA family ATPase [Lentisphaerae bacterium]|nr:AAA family ATPase [Lentisphaerota bacterium]
MRQSDILSYFNLEKHPFDKEISTQELIELPSNIKAHGELQLLIETKGIGILTGPSGCGKSSLIRKTAHTLNPGLYRPFYVFHSSLSTADFYQSFAAAMNLSPQGRRSSIFRRIKEQIINLNDQQRIHPVIFIDEAHSLNTDSLKEIRMLTNFEYDSKNACTILLCGHSELIHKLKLNILSSLANSITHSIKLDSMSGEETFTYIEGRINSCGGHPGLYTKNAMKLIHDISGGILRTSANAAWRSLIKAYEHKSAQVEKEYVNMIVNQ